MTGAGGHAINKGALSAITTRIMALALFKRVSTVLARIARIAMAHIAVAILVQLAKAPRAARILLTKCQMAEDARPVMVALALMNGLVFGHPSQPAVAVLAAR